MMALPQKGVTNMKKLLSLLLVAIMAMSSLAVSYAENMEDGSNYSISAT